MGDGMACLKLQIVSKELFTLTKNVNTFVLTL